MPPSKGRSPEDDASQTTITLKQMAAELADGHNLSKQQTEALLNDLMTLATRHIKDGHRVRLTGLGVLHVQRGLNQQTGEVIAVRDKGEFIATLRAERRNWNSPTRPNSPRVDAFALRLVEAADTEFDRLKRQATNLGASTGLEPMRSQWPRGQVVDTQISNGDLLFRECQNTRSQKPDNSQF
jgi:DNA-binding protein HU-beta